jgi:hypothetical protein
LEAEPLPHKVPPMISSTGDKRMKGGELRAAGQDQ